MDFTPLTQSAQKTKGYIRLSGVVKNRKRYKNALSLTLESHHKKPIQITIKNKNKRYFKSVNFDRLIGKSIIVSGMLKNKRNKRIIQLNHSSQLQILQGSKLNQ